MSPEFVQGTIGFECGNRWFNLNLKAAEHVQIILDFIAGKASVADVVNLMAAQYGVPIETLELFAKACSGS